MTNVDFDETWSNITTKMEQEASQVAADWLRRADEYYDTITSNPHGNVLLVRDNFGQLLAAAGVTSACNCVMVHFFHVWPSQDNFTAAFDLYAEMLQYGKPLFYGYVCFALPVVPGLQHRHITLASLDHRSEQDVPSVAAFLEQARNAVPPVITYSIKRSDFETVMFGL